MARQQYGWQIDKEESVTYLPLSHIAGAVIDIFVPFQARIYHFLVTLFRSILVINDHETTTRQEALFGLQTEML